MICKSCKNEFNNVDGLKFCPYCGTKIEEAVSSKEEAISSKVEGVSDVKGTQEESVERTISVDNNRLHDTLEMPVITNDDIERYNRGRVPKSKAKPFKHMKAVISIVTAIVLIGLGVVGYMFLSNKTVDEARIKQDLLGKVITLPKGTRVEIKNGYIKSLSINSRNTDKNAGKDDIKAAVTLNNESIEVTTVLSVHYLEDKNKWKISDNIELAEDTTVKPVAGMDESQFIEELKKQSISIGDTSKALSGSDVKNLQIVEKTPDFDRLSENFLVETTIDNGTAAASGKLRCSLNFQNEAWSIAKVERNSTDDFSLTLSPDFNQDNIVQSIKNAGMEETVTNSSVFGGKGFYVKDSFTKNINISSKNFDDKTGILTVTAKRENAAGDLKTVLSTDYTFNLSLDKLELIKKGKTTVDSVVVNDIPTDLIIASITNAEVEGGDLFFWFSDNHKITADEAKTYKGDKVLSKKGLQNVKYVYGSITYADGSKKSKSIVALYYLVYDGSKGYSWKLDRIVGEDSPNYKLYVPEPH